MSRKIYIYLFFIHELEIPLLLSASIEWRWWFSTMRLPVVNMDMVFVCECFVYISKLFSIVDDVIRYIGELRWTKTYRTEYTLHRYIFRLGFKMLGTHIGIFWIFSTVMVMDKRNVVKKEKKLFFFFFFSEEILHSFYYFPYSFIRSFIANEHFCREFSFQRIRFNEKKSTKYAYDEDLNRNWAIYSYFA